MNTIQQIAQSPLVSRLGWALLHSLWQGAAVAVVLACAVAVLRKRSPRSRYFASCVAMIALAALPCATFIITPAGATASSPPVAQTVARPIEPIPVVTAGTTSVAPAQDDRRQPLSDSAPAGIASVSSTAAPDLSSSATMASRVSAALPWLVVAWLCGVLALSLWNLGGWMSLRQLQSLSTSSAPALAREQVRRLSGSFNLTFPIRVVQSAIAHTPLVVGAFKPVILLPASVFTELSAAELESILAHELAHIARHDYLVNLLQTVIETLLFYHPAAWWISRKIRAEREHCCDDLALSVTRDRKTYVTALAAVASIRIPQLAAAASGGNLAARLRRVLGTPDTDAGRSRWLSGALVIAICFIALLIAALPTSATAAAGDDDTVTVHGQVLDPAGKPAAGARLQTIAWPFTTALSEARSNADGTFTITFKKSQFASTWNSWESTVLAATSPGYAPAWARANHVDAAGNVVLQLAADDMPVEGRVVTLEGQPVVGAKVTLTNLQPKAVDLKDLGVNRSPPPEEYGNEDTPNLPGFAAGINPTAVADKDGRFRMTGLGRDRTASLHVEGPGITFGWLDVLTKDVPRQTRTFQYQPFAATGIQYGAKFEFTASPGRVVTGTVRDAATGKPLAGVTVSDSTVASQPVTDAQGHYQTQGVPKRKDVKFTAIPTDDQPYFMCEANVPDAPGMAPVTIDFNLHRGVWITGKVTDKATGKPIGAARVRYLPYLTNKNFDNLPEFHFGRRQIPGGQSERYTTNADGMYRVVALPGPALVIAEAIGRAYRSRIDLDQIKCPMGPGQRYLTYEPATNGDSNVVKDVNIAEGVEQTTLDMQCDPGATIHLSLVDPDNNPLEGVLVLHHSPGSPYRKLKTSTVDAIAFRPDEKRRLFFFHNERKLGRIITVGVDDAPNGRLKIKLEPYSNITGRLLGADGQPMANAAIQGFPFELPMASTDAEGRFQMPLLPGAPYNLHGFKDGDSYFTDAENLTLTPGVTKDLGDVHRRSLR